MDTNEISLDEIIKEIDENIKFNLGLIKSRINTLEYLATNFSLISDEFAIKKNHLIDEIVHLRGCISGLNFLKDSLHHKK